jgi:RNA polymerase sigma factor (sigma-70 family)
MTTAAAGEHRWAEIYRSEFPRLYRAVLAVVRDRERALDAVHDAFFEGLKRPPAREDNLAGWLFTVAIRRARRFRRLVPLPKPAADDQIERLMDRLEVGRLLAGLSERQRAVIVAQFYLGLRQTEIADLLGIKVGTVSATVAHARKRMRLEADHVA